MSDLNSFRVFLRIVQSLKDDGALEKEDWLILLPLMIELIKALKHQIQNRVILQIALSGVEKVLEETLAAIRDDS